MRPSLIPGEHFQQPPLSWSMGALFNWPVNWWGPGRLCGPCLNPCSCKVKLNSLVAPLFQGRGRSQLCKLPPAPSPRYSTGTMQDFFGNPHNLSLQTFKISLITNYVVNKLSLPACNSTPENF